MSSNVRQEARANSKEPKKLVDKKHNSTCESTTKLWLLRENCDVQQNYL